MSRRQKFAKSPHLIYRDKPSKAPKKPSEAPTKGAKAYVAQISQQYKRCDEALRDFLKAFKVEIDEKLSMKALTAQPKSHILQGTTPSCILTANLPNLTSVKLPSDLKNLYQKPLQAILEQRSIRFFNTTQPWRDANNICKDISNAKGNLKQGLDLHKEHLLKQGAKNGGHTPFSIKKAFQNNDGKEYILNPLKKLINTVERSSILTLSGNKGNKPSELQVTVNKLKQFERGIDRFIETGKTEEEQLEARSNVLDMNPG